MTIRSYQYQVQVLVTPSSGSDVSKSVAQGLGLSDTATYEINTVEVSAENTLELAENVLVEIEFGGYSNFVQDLNLTQEVSSMYHPYVAQDLGITDEATYEVADLIQSVEQDLGITDEVEYGYLVRNVFVEDDLTLTDEAALSFDGNASNTLNLTDYASWTDIFDDLGLTDSATWGYGIDVVSTLDLSDQVLVDKTLNQSITDTLAIGDAVAYYIESRCGRHRFQSFHGTGGVAPIDQKLNYETNQFIIQSLDDGTLLSFRTPETDDRRRIAFNRVNRSFFDGTADIYTDTNWVTEETQIYTIVATKREDLDSLQNFLLDNLGREVLIKDWKGVTWIVIITNPGELYTEDGEGYWTIDFEVEGEAIEGEYVLDQSNLSQDVSRAGSIWNRSGTSTIEAEDFAGYERDINVPAQNVSLTDSATYTIESP